MEAPKQFSYLETREQKMYLEDHRTDLKQQSISFIFGYRVCIPCLVNFSKNLLTLLTQFFQI